MPNVTVIPAQPGYFTVYDMGKLLELAEEVIAWRVETDSGKTGNFSVVIALTVDGDVADNCIGVKNPDGTVTLFQDSTYATLADANARKFPG